MQTLKLIAVGVLLLLACLQASPKLKHLLGIRFPQFKLFDPQKRYKKAIAKGKVELIQLPKHGEADYMKTHIMTDNTPVVLFIIFGSIPVIFLQQIIFWSMSKDLYAYILSITMLLALSYVVYVHSKTEIRQLKHQLTTGYEDCFDLLYPDVVIRRRVTPWYVKMRLAWTYIGSALWFIGMPLLSIWLFFYKSSQ